MTHHWAFFAADQNLVAGQTAQPIAISYRHYADEFLFLCNVGLSIANPQPAGKRRQDARRAFQVRAGW